MLVLLQGASVLADGSLLIENMVGTGGTWEALNITIAGDAFDTVLPRMLSWRGGSKFCYSSCRNTFLHLSLHANSLFFAQGLLHPSCCSRGSPFSHSLWLR